jgi:hypothetical protein
MEKKKTKKKKKKKKREPLALDGIYDAVRLNIFCLMKDIQVMPELLKLIC